jgi:type II secretory pathway component GspD/PulD (secretin)
MKIKSGEVMVIGGLMTEEAANTDNGVPGLSSIPLFGNLFKSVSKGSSVKQTVIFIKATIMPSNGAPVEDKHFYNDFSRKRDTHPLEFKKLHY